MRFSSKERLDALPPCRELMLATRCHTDARNHCVHMTLKVHGEYCYGAHVCLLARRRLIEESADVLPVRQRNYSKIDNYWSPRH
jgi:hypothetical protein